MGQFLKAQSNFRSPNTQQPAATRTHSSERIPQLSAHPNFELPLPKRYENIIVYTLRCAATLVSPPKLDAEDEDTPCEVVANAIMNLHAAVLSQWQKGTLEKL